MPIFTPYKLTLSTGLLGDAVMEILDQMMENAPVPELKILHGDLHLNEFDLHWQPQNRKAAALVVEGKLRPEADGTDIHLQVMLEPSHQVTRLIWLGFVGLLFLLTLFGPPPAWTSIFPLGVMIMMYFRQEQSFTDSVRNMRSSLCQELQAEIVEG